MSSLGSQDFFNTLILKSFFSFLFFPSYQSQHIDAFCRGLWPVWDILFSFKPHNSLLWDPICGVSQCAFAFQKWKKIHKMAEGSKSSLYLCPCLNIRYSPPPSSQGFIFIIRLLLLSMENWVHTCKQSEQTRLWKKGVTLSAIKEVFGTWIYAVIWFSKTQSMLWLNFPPVDYISEEAGPNTFMIA